MVARSKVATHGILWLLCLAAVMAATEEQARIVQLELDKELMARRLQALETAFATATPAPPDSVASQQYRPTDRSSVVDTRLMQKPQSF